MNSKRRQQPRSSPAAEGTNRLSFLQGGGEMGERIRAHDWASTPLGDPATWPQALRTLVALMLPSRQPMFMAWGNERIWLYNDAFVPIMGEKHPLGLGLHALDEVWSEAREVLVPLFERVFEGEPVHRDDFEILLDRHGRLEEAHFSFSYNPVRDESGGVAGLFGVCTETTALVLADRQRAAEQERLRRMFEQAPSFMTIMEGPEHVVTFVNDAHRSLFDSGDWIGKPIREAFPEIEGQGYFELLDGVYRTGERYVAASSPVRYRRPQEPMVEERLLDFVYEPILDAAGRCTGIFCEGTDVTEARRAEQALRESESRLRFLEELGVRTRSSSSIAEILRQTTRLLAEHLNAQRCAYADVGDGDRVSIVEEWAREAPPSVDGYRLDGFAEQAGRELRAGRPLVVSDTGLPGALESTSEIFASLEARAAVCHPHVVGGKLLALVVVCHSEPRDWTEAEVSLVGAVAERSWAYVDRLRTQQLLLEADRRKDEFLATLAHELRNPLAPIRQAAAIAKSPATSEAQRRWSQEVIERQSSHMARLLDDLLDVSRITRGQLTLRREQIEVDTVLDMALEAAAPLIEARRHRIEVSRPETPVVLNVDPVRMAQVVSNLLTNAAKYTDDGGRLELVARQDADGVVIAVRDSGIGIEPAMVGRVFEMFSQARGVLERSEGGLGIGLALVRGIVELHGGSIEAHSEGLGRGSEFIVALPRSAMDVEPAQPRSALPVSGGVPCRILLADDNRDAAETLRTLLELDGHEVTVAYDGVAALEAAESCNPDVALLDIGMPQLSGYEIARRIRAEPWGARIKLAAITGWGQAEDRRKALDAGFDQHLTKPVSPGDLGTLLESFADRDH